MRMRNVFLMVLACGMTAGLQAEVDSSAMSPVIAAPVSSNSVVLENEYVSLTVQTAGNRLANAVLQDKLNGLSYDLGPDFFAIYTPGAGEALDKMGASSFLAGNMVQEEIKANPEARRLVERSAGSKVMLPFSTKIEGMQVTWWAEVREGHPYVRVGLTITAEHGPVAARKITLVDIAANDALVAGTVKGAPVVASGNRLFLGVENPMSLNEVQDGRVTASLTSKVDIPSRAPFKVSAVIGVSSPTQLRRTFQLSYINEERVRPYGAFLNYNTWYDIGYFDRYNEKAALDTIKMYGEELVRKRGVVIDSFMLDDGWDDTSTLWKFHKGLPNEFREIRKLAESYGAGPGVWFSPWGGYGQPKEDRLKAAAETFKDKAALETNDSGLALAGPNYYKHFREMCLHMIKENGINHFKLDGTSGVETSIPGSKFASDFDAIISLITELRGVRPDLYVNLTTGTWASPFWFGIADSIWRGGWDHEFVGEGSQRNKWMTFRDAKIYVHNVQVSPLFPINSLMTHGVIYTKRARSLEKSENDELVNEIWSGFGSGTQMQEIYVTPSLLTQAEWDVLATAAKWARENQKTLVDTHWVGGNPVDLQVYGWASWAPEKGIITVRNPSSKPQAWSFDPAAVFELPVGAATDYALSSPKGDALPVKTAKAGAPVTLLLQPYQVVVIEALPVGNASPEQDR